MHLSHEDAGAKTKQMRLDATLDGSGWTSVKLFDLSQTSANNCASTDRLYQLSLIKRSVLEDNSDSKSSCKTTEI